MFPALLPAARRAPGAGPALPILALAVQALLFAAPAAASHVGEELTADQQTVQSNDSLIGALRQFENLPPAARAAREAALVRQAQARSERLVQLLERNPRLAALRTLPPGLRERLPAAAQPFVEQDGVALRGRVFATVADDFERGVSRRTFQIQPEGGGPALRLHLGDAAGTERDLLGWTGRAVRLSGTRLGDHLLIKQRGNVQLLAAEGTTTTTAGAGNVTPTTTPVITGNRRTLAILVNFSDAALSCTAADVNTRLFGTTGATVNTMFRESSRDVVAFSGTTHGPVQIPYSAGGTCDFNAWGSAADAAARAAGVDPSQYNHVTYVTPRAASCGWAGLAYMPGTRSWVQSCSATGVYAHELGHNLSLHHAATPTSEYGDGSDTMGGARTVRANGANQVMAGWVPTGGLLDVFTGGSYSIGALQPASTGVPQVLRLNKTDTNEFYYVSLRTNTGNDVALPSNFVNTISVHRAGGRLPTKTYILQTLLPGASFVDSVNGLQIVNQGVSNGVATVSVAFTGSTCERRPPTVALNPASAQAPSGSAVTYGATITNNNTAACGTSTLALAQALPAGFSGTVSSASLAVAAGSSALVNWQVRSAATVADGTYTLDLTATESGQPGTTAHAAYTAMLDATGPVLSIVSPAVGAVLTGRSATISATATDTGGVAAVEFYVDGKLLARDTTAPYSANWNLRRVSKGAHTVTVRALDAAGNTTARDVGVTVN